MPPYDHGAETSSPPRTIVIGAGVSGLACARELRQRRHDVLVLEARNRVGGRLRGISLGENRTSKVDLGGALIHGIAGNPIYELCQHMNVETRPVSSTLLFDDAGCQIDPSHDQQVSKLFNEVLEETFEEASAAAKPKAKSFREDNFGSLFEQKAQAHLQKMSSENKSLFEWHKQNLEVSCGASFQKLGYQWNEDEAYGYDGAHVALPESTWSTVMEQLASGVSIRYGAQVKRIQLVTLNGNNKKTGQKLQQQQKASNIRRSSRSNKGVAGETFSIASTSSMSYDDSLRKRLQRPRIVIHVTLSDGTILQADSVVCTLPLGVLKLEPEEGGVEFDPPLPAQKQESIQKLGCGVLNKCALLFSHVFWQNDDFLGVVSTNRQDQKFHLMVNHNRPQPALVFWFGGDFAKEIQDWTDVEIVEDCLSVLQQATGKAPPTPLDYAVTRWGMEPLSRGAFVYMPPGTNPENLGTCSEPILCPYSRRPVLLFAGEHTTPYHPSTIHGAYLTGIREAYRLDLAVAPVLNNYLDFCKEAMYKRTFSVKKKTKKTTNKTKVVKATTAVAASPYHKRKDGSNNQSVMTLRKRPRTTSSKTSSNNRVVDTAKHETVATTPLRKSHRSTAGKRLFEHHSSEQTNNGTTGFELDQDQVNVTLRRAVESYGKAPESWRLIQSKILTHMSVGQLRARYQKLLKESPPQRSKGVNYDSWIVSKPETNSSKQKKKPPSNKDRRKSSRKVIPRVLFDA